MSTLSALLVLGQATFLGASWWVARALRPEEERVAAWVIWPTLALSLLGSVPEIGAALAHSQGFVNAAHGAGLASAAAMAMSQVGLMVLAGERAVRSENQRRRMSELARAQLRQGDLAFAAGRRDEARAAYQAQVSTAQAAGEPPAIRLGLTRIAWLEYLGGDFEQARASIGWAAGGGALDEALGSEIVLLAGCLALAGGRTEVARPAIEDALGMAAAAEDVSQTGLASIALGCVHYIEGWTESASQYVESHIGDPMEIFDRHAAGALLTALSLAARHRGNATDAFGFAQLAAPLLEGDAALAPVAAHAARPEASPGLERPARAQMALVLPPAQPAPVAV